ncbi:MAG: prepilin-type N-terminal cleavage/methylation domain-containing protein [Gemmatimonadetes bacterium]|nr:prepilin-type N-terminal cleavage/methylation domain-containing protein [Gemmatimonadota bacterium]
MTTSRTRLRARRGFSLIELLITIVLVGIIGVAAGRMLMSQTRFYSRLAGQKDARSVTRNARNIIQTELAMVQADNGVVAASNDSIRVRMPIMWGVFCSNSTIMYLPYDSAMFAMASYAGYAIKDTTAAGTYSYTSASSAPTAGTATNCTASPVDITAPTNGGYRALSPTATATAGSPVFLYQEVTYKFASSGLFSGKRGLFRRVANGTYEELLAPFDTSAKFRFYNLFADTAQTAVPTLANIRGVELMLDAQSPTRTSGQSNPETASIKTAIFFRNRVD